MKILVTGNAGFIGFHVAKKLIERGDEIVGIDSVNTYYDQQLKEARLGLLQKTAANIGSNYTFIHGNLADQKLVEDCFRRNKFDRVIHLAAQAGVRYSLENPHSYIESNIVAFANILELCRTAQIPHLTYASSSSVYGANTLMPFSEHHGVDHPLQIYAATKRSNELMSHSYSHLFKLPTTGLRFFTVYGPWGRPDMALFKFTKNILEGKPISVFNNGNHSRDFTYIEDVVEGVVRASDQIALPNPNWTESDPDPATSADPFRIFNVGNNKPVKLSSCIEAIESALGKKALIEFLPIQRGDVPHTNADSGNLERAIGYAPATSLKEGVKYFVDWYVNYYYGCKGNAIKNLEINTNLF
jgi:UDP-glucuronate 4-epimerase